MIEKRALLKQLRERWDQQEAHDWRYYSHTCARIWIRPNDVPANAIYGRHHNKGPPHQLDTNLVEEEAGPL